MPAVAWLGMIYSLHGLLKWVCAVKSLISYYLQLHTRISSAVGCPVHTLINLYRAISIHIYISCPSI